MWFAMLERSLPRLLATIQGCCFSLANTYHNAAAIDTNRYKKQLVNRNMELVDVYIAARVP
jgi:hypothetical protein